MAIWGSNVAQASRRSSGLTLNIGQGPDMDYVHDHQASVEYLHKDFDHPYPIVQDTEDYDKDFVRDENKDNGAWKAQYEYDLLRAQLRKEWRELDAAGRALHGADKWNKIKQKLKQDDDDYRGAHDEELGARKRLADAEERLAAAEAAVAKAEADLKAAQKAAGDAKLPLTSEVAAAQDAVKAAEAELKAAQEALAEAQKRLEEVLEQQRKALAAQKASLAQKKAAALEKIKIANQDLDAAEAARTQAQADYDSATKRVAIEKQLMDGKQRASDEADARYNDLLRNYQKEKADVERLKAQLEKAAEKVRALREAVGKGGAVYYVPGNSAGTASFFRSSARSAAAFGPIVALVLLMSAWRC